MMDEHTQREFGTQRLDELMRRWNFTNHDLVLAYGTDEQLTHKQVQRARSGRKLTLNMMQKITRALNAAILLRLSSQDSPHFQPYLHRDLFCYAKGFVAADWHDPNDNLPSEQ